METARERTFGEMVQGDLWEPFLQARGQLKELESKDASAMALMEVADAVTYDEAKCTFQQVYRNVPDSPPRKSRHTVVVPMSLSELRALTEFIAELARAS